MNEEATERPDLPSRVLVSGSSGLIGRALCRVLEQRGCEVLRLVRGGPEPGALRWDPASGRLDPPPAEPFGVVHLAGENVGKGRWTAQRRAQLERSRVDATRGLCRSLAALDPAPTVFVAASAIGYYGDRGDEELDEDSAPGEGFFPELCQAWESASEELDAVGTRRVHGRLGLVLAEGGGALAPMVPLFRWGLGGRLGSGRQWWSWISHDDTLRAFVRLLEDPSLRGPVNLVAPGPVTNSEFTRVLARRLRRPALLPAPRFGLRLALGSEKADCLLMASARVRASRLQTAGFEFRHPELSGALAALDL